MSNRPERPRLATAAVVVLAGLALAACVAGSAESGQSASGGMIAQFLLGLWHGIIGPVMLIGEIVGRFAPHLLPWKLHFYETRATGAAYDLGFYLGLAGGPPFAWSRWRR